jgi:hypothetical protein
VSVGAEKIAQFSKGSTALEPGGLVEFVALRQTLPAEQAP